MKKFFPIYVRIPLLMVLFYGLVEYFVDSGNKPAFVEYPEVLVLYLLFVFVLIAIEIMGAASRNIVNRLMTPEERAEKERLDNLPITESAWYKKMMKALTRSKAIEEEKEIELDHDYDGIRELDNDLPPWWKYLFYATIIFSFVYLIKYHLMDGDNQIEELNKEIAQAEIEIEEYKKTAPDMLTADQVVLLTDPADIAAGKAIFQQNCIACHGPEGGGGIGPNLTDDYWILGGDIKQVFTTISEGGRDGKGMVPWKGQFKPTEIQKIASFVKSLRGTNPANPKQPEGDLYTPEGAEGADNANADGAAENTENKEESTNENATAEQA